MRNNFVVIDSCFVQSLDVETKFTKLVQSLEVETFKQRILCLWSHISSTFLPLANEKLH